MPVANRISGPAAVTQHWSAPLEKMVYVFGELHGHEDACKPRATSIHDYLRKLAITTGAFIDLYLETTLDDRSDLFQWFLPNYISKVRGSFAKCIRPKDRHAERCRLLRVHYVDTRQKKQEENNVLSLFSLMLRYDARGFFLPGDKKEIMEVLPYLIGKRSPSYIREQYKRETVKEMSRVYPNRMRSAIKRYAKELVGEALKEHGREMSDAAEVLQEALHRRRPSKVVKDAMYELYAELVPVLSPMVDVYTLARMFKRFDVSKRPGSGSTGMLWWKKPVEGWGQPVEPHSIVYYAGNNHANRVRAFLGNTGFETIGQGEQLSTRCVSMGSVTQPMFV